MHLAACSRMALIHSPAWKLADRQRAMPGLAIKQILDDACTRPLLSYTHR